MEYIYVKYIYVNISRTLLDFKLNLAKYCGETAMMQTLQNFYSPIFGDNLSPYSYIFPLNISMNNQISSKLRAAEKLVGKILFDQGSININVNANNITVQLYTLKKC